MTATVLRPGPPCHREVARAALPTAVSVAHVPEGGQVACVGLDGCSGTSFEFSQPARKIPAYRRQRNMPGWWWSSTTGEHVVYESWLERHHLMEFDRQPRVVGISGQPFALSWQGEVRRHSHVPDLFVRFADGSAMVIDCRPVERADEQFHRVAAVTRAVCEEVAWDYRLAGEPSATRAANLRWLAGYRRPSGYDEQTTRRMIELATHPVPLREVATAIGDPIAMLPCVFQLLWTGALSCDLEQPLTDHSSVWADRG